MYALLPPATGGRNFLSDNKCISLSQCVKILACGRSPGGKTRMQCCPRQYNNLRWLLRRGSPLPIPNREVKPACADGTAVMWESMSSPFFWKPCPYGRGFLFTALPGSHRLNPHCQMTAGIFCLFLFYLFIVQSTLPVPFGYTERGWCRMALIGADFLLLVQIKLTLFIVYSTVFVYFAGLRYIIWFKVS